MDEGAEDKEGDGDGKHEKPALYQCPFPDCGKRFTRPYNLKSHYRSHTGERPYQCNSCTMNFCRRHDLKRHEKLHGGGKPHVCLACGKSFARLDALKRHLRSSDVSKSTCSQKVRLLQLSAKVFPGAGGVGDPGGSSSSDGLS
ncbi:hypothetical protein DFJ73DRAFT_629563 [Zopfochytrium polystomum]|nr:hypothetical protein DFJ73DRAFT_629563 [Zopfochytrium polystomum]